MGDDHKVDTSQALEEFENNFVNVDEAVLHDLINRTVPKDTDHKHCN